MVVAVVKKVGDELVIVIPSEAAEREGLHEGARVEVVPAGAGADLAEDLARIVDERWERNLPALEYLAGR